MNIPADSAIHALALVILLKCISVRLAPVVKCWELLSLQELVEIRSILCQSRSEYWAQQVLLAMENSYDWKALDRGYFVLKEQWFRAVKVHGSFSSYVLSMGDRLEKTMRRNSAPVFAVGGESTWSFQCQQALTTLHTGHETVVSIPQPISPTLPYLVYGSFFHVSVV